MTEPILQVSAGQSGEIMEGKPPVFDGSDPAQQISTTLARDKRQDALRAELEALEGAPLVIKSGRSQQIGSEAVHQALGRPQGIHGSVRADRGPEAIFGYPKQP